MGFGLLGHTVYGLNFGWKAFDRHPGLKAQGLLAYFRVWGCLRLPGLGPLPLMFNMSPHYTLNPKPRSIDVSGIGVSNISSMKGLASHNFIAGPGSPIPLTSRKI